MAEKVTRKEEQIAAGIYVMYIGIFAFSAFFGLYGLGAARFTSSLDLFKIYAGLAAIGGLVIITRELIPLLSRLTEVIIHEPKNSPIMNIQIPIIKKLQNPLTLLFLSFSFFLSIGLIYTVIPQTAAYLPQTSIPVILKSSGLFSSNLGILITKIFPASPAETNIFLNIFISLMILTPLKIILSLVGRVGWYNNMKKNPVFFTLFGIFLAYGIGGFSGLQMHDFIYGNDPQQLIRTYLFWSIQTFVWWIAQSIIPAEAQHISHNFIAAMNDLFSSNGLAIFVIIFLIFLNMILFLVSLSKIYGNFVKRLSVI